MTIRTYCLTISIVIILPVSVDVIVIQCASSFFAYGTFVTPVLVLCFEKSEKSEAGGTKTSGNHQGAIEKRLEEKRKLNNINFKISNFMVLVHSSQIRVLIPLGIFTI